MAEDYKDLCEFGEDTGDDSNAGSESSAPSIPPFMEFGPSPGDGDINPIDTLSSPNEDLGTNIRSPELEIIRGNIQAASRTILMIPQEFVYNFPAFRNNTQGPDFRINVSGIKSFDSNNNPPYGDLGLRIPAPKDSSKYVVSGQNAEVIATRVTSQDSLRYVCGKIFIEGSVRRFGSANGTDLEDFEENQFRDSVSIFQPMNNQYIGQWEAVARRGYTDFTRVYKQYDPKIFIQSYYNDNILQTYENGLLSKKTFYSYVSVGLTPLQAERYAGREVDIIEMEDYLMSLVPDSDLLLGGGVLELPAAFYEQETSYIDRTPGVYGSVKINFPRAGQVSSPIYEITDELLQLGDRDYYQRASFAKRTNESLYRELLRALPQMVDFELEPDPLRNRAEWLPFADIDYNPECVVSEKYSSRGVAAINECNSLFNVRAENIITQDTSNIATNLDLLAPLNVEINFADPERESRLSGKVVNINRIIKTKGIDTILLAMLDYLFSESEQENDVLFDSLVAYGLEQDFFDDNFDNDFYENLDNPELFYEPKNKKVSYNYRPRTHKHFLRKMRDFFHVDTPEAEITREQKVEVITKLFGKIEEYPLGYPEAARLSQLTEDEKIIFTENENQIIEVFDRFRESVHDFSRAVPAVLFPENGAHEHYLPTDLRSIFNGFKLAYCTVAYRIEKVNASNGKVLKEIYLFNNPDIEDFKFYDSQVLVGDRYRYNIYSINFVVDYEYKYTDNTYPAHRDTSVNSVATVRSPGPGTGQGPWPGESKPGINGELVSVPNNPRLGTGNQYDRGAPTIRAEVEVHPHFKIVEAPFFSQEVTVVDRPPLVPSVDLDKLGRDEEGRQEFRIRFSQESGKVTETPIKILDEDEEIIARMRSHQIFNRPPETPESAIVYSSDSEIEEYEVLVLREEPVINEGEYDSFSEAEVYRFPGTAPFFTFPAPVNEERYMVFRARDRHGISNPTKIYKFLFNSYGDGEYYEFDIFEPELQIVRQRLEMSCERYLSVEPAVDQAILNFGVNSDSSPQEVVDRMQSAPTMGEVTIGHVEPESSIWDKDYKIRLVSKNTGRAIDLNFKFLFNKYESAAYELESSANRISNTCTDTIVEKNNTIRQQIERSNQSLKDSLDLIGGEGDG